MNLRYLSLIAFMLCTFALQAANYELSNELDFSKEGWNKVLQTSDGNTVLFHFEHNKSVLVKVFDSTRKEIASEKFMGKVIDLAQLEESELHGVYEFGSEAVIFISQFILNNHTLVALRFNTTTGKIIKEQKLVSSPSFKARNSYSVVRNTSAGGYAVFCMKDLEANFKETIQLLVFDENHNMTQEVPVTIDTKEYDFIEHVSTNVGEDGAYVVTLTCKKIIHFPDEIDRYLALCYLPKGAKLFNNVITKLPESFYPYYTMYTYNPFAEKLNLFLVNAQTLTYKYGLETRSEVIYNSVMLMYPAINLGSLSFETIAHKHANKYLQEETDTTQYIKPIPTRVYTNKYGLTTLISEENELKLKFQNQVTNRTLIGNVTITQINDEGKELWATILPKKQFVENALTVYDIHKRGTYTKLFRRYDPTSDWIYQFVSYKSIMKPNGDCYIIFNDLNSNRDNTISTGVDSMYSRSTTKNYENTNAVIYKVTRKREVTKENVFDTPDSTTNYAAMIEGSDYNETTQSFACVLLCREGNKYIQKLGWRKLDD